MDPAPAPPADWLSALNVRLDRIEAKQEKILQALKEKAKDSESESDGDEDLMLAPVKVDLRRIITDILFESRERIQKNPQIFDPSAELARIYEAFEVKEIQTGIDVPAWNLDGLKERKTVNAFVSALSALRARVDEKTDEQLKLPSVFDNLTDTNNTVKRELDNMLGIFDGILAGKKEALAPLTEGSPQLGGLLEGLFALVKDSGIVTPDNEQVGEIKKQASSCMKNIQSVFKSMPLNNTSSFQVYPMAIELMKYQSYGLKDLIESQEFFDKLKELASKYQGMGQEDLIELERILSLPKFNYERDGLLFDTCKDLKKEMTGFTVIPMLRGYVLLIQVARDIKYDWLADATPENIKQKVHSYIYRE